MNSYAVLHAHDTYGSIGDSILYIKDYVKTAKELGIRHLAITNHGSLSTFVEFYETCIANEIHPIIGCEFYYINDITVKDKTEKRNHLILLAKNETGLKNLIRLHNIATDTGFYYKPRIDFATLEENADGLICLTACIAGHIPRAILQDNIEMARNELMKFKQLFSDDFYIEIQPGDFTEQQKANRELVSLGNQLKIPVVITNDVHYLKKDEWNIHDYHVKESRKQLLDSPQVYPDKVYYLMSRAELKKAMLKNGAVSEEVIDTALDETIRLAEKVTAKLPEDKFMPCYDSAINEAETLSSLCWKQLKKIENKLTDPAVYVSRLEQELDTIHTLGFDGYFLIVKDLVDFCDREHIGRGPGRGSAVGSLVSYLLNISVADPIKYGLLFERFLSKNRPGNPDIDLDLDPEKRDLVYQHIVTRYGKDHCCFVSTFNRRKARAAIKAATRILNHSVATGDMLSKEIPYVAYDESGEKHSDISVKEALATIPQFQRIAKNHQDIIDLAIQLEGYPSSVGIHPAGIVISPIDITDRYPLIRAKDKFLHATSLDLNNVEKLSGVKFDLLALSNLTTISAVLNKTGVTIDYTNDAFFENPNVWNLIGSSCTTGLFQISSSTYKSRMPLLHPRSITGLAACLALVRGPCISSGADKKYIRVLQGKGTPDFICTEYWKHTKDTCGIIIYQEQVLEICQEIGMDSEDSYKLLKACSKKKADVIAAYESLFKKAAKQKHLPENSEQQIWNEILNSAKYAFNVSHATAYAILCYVSAWLKIHYPLEYMCELLNKVYNKPDADEIRMTIQDCLRLQIHFCPLDINRSQWNFTVEENGIRIGFCAVKGLGQKAYEAIQEAPKPLTGLHDVLEKISGRRCNKRSIMLLILSGALQSITELTPIQLLKTYITDIRKESMEDYIKIGKNNIAISAGEDEIKKEIFGTVFEGKEEVS